VRKLRACGGNSRGPSAPENAQMVSRLRATSNLSLWASNSVPMPVVGERKIPGKNHRYRELGGWHWSFGWEKSAGLSIAF
jgi:hypothetical protein